MKKSLSHTVWECKYHIDCEMGDSDYKGWKAVIQKRRIHHLAIFHNHILIQGLAHAPPTTDPSSCPSTSIGFIRPRISIF